MTSALVWPGSSQRSVWRGAAGGVFAHGAVSSVSATSVAELSPPAILPGIEDVFRVELGFQPCRQRGECRRLRLEHRHGRAPCRACAHQRRVAAAELPDQSAQRVGFRLGLHAQPDQPALPVVEGVGAGLHAQRKHYFVRLGRRHRDAPDRPRGAVGEGRAVAYVAPQLLRAPVGHLLDRPGVLQQCLQRLDAIGDRGPETFDAQQRRCFRAAHVARHPLAHAIGQVRRSPRLPRSTPSPAPSRRWRPRR